MGARLLPQVSEQAPGLHHRLVECRELGRGGQVLRRRQGMTAENLRRGLSKGEVESLRQEAWIGDAVLELYARRWVLEETNCRDAERKARFVRNSFLSHLGQPTRVEAE